MAIVNYRESYAISSKYFQKIKDTYSTNTQIRESVELLLTFLTISFFIVFALRPTVNTISELISNINSQKEIQGKLDTKLADLTRARQNYTREEKRLFLVEQALPENPTPDLYLRQLEGLVGTYSLTLKSLSIGETLLFGVLPKNVQDDAKKKEKVPGVRGSQISFVVLGNFEDITEFVDDIENLRQTLLVDTFSLGISQGIDLGKISLTISGSVPNFPKQKNDN